WLRKNDRLEQDQRQGDGAPRRWASTLACPRSSAVGRNRTTSGEGIEHEILPSPASGPVHVFDLGGGLGPRGASGVDPPMTSIPFTWCVEGRALRLQSPLAWWVRIRSLHELNLANLRHQPCLRPFAQQPPYRFAAARAVVERPLVDVHADE